MKYIKGLFKKLFSTKDQLLEFAFYCLLGFVCVLALFISQCVFSQPLKNAEEIVFEIHDVHLYHETGDFAKYMDDIKISASIVSGKLGNFQTSAIFKVTGEKAALGGQAWYKVGKNFWLGGEATTDMKLKIGSELMASYEINTDKWTIYPYFSVLVKKEKLGSLGLKLHYKKLFSFGMEVKKIVDAKPKVVEKTFLNYLQNDYKASFFIGVPLDKKVVKKLFDTTFK